MQEDTHFIDITGKLLPAYEDMKKNEEEAMQVEEEIKMVVLGKSQKVEKANQEETEVELGQEATEEQLVDTDEQQEKLKMPQSEEREITTK